MGVKFVTPKDGDAVAVVARSVEAEEVDEEPASEAARSGDASTAERRMRQSTSEPDEPQTESESR